MLVVLIDSGKCIVSAAFFKLSLNLYVAKVATYRF